MQKLCCAVNLQCLERIKTIRSLILCSDCAFVWLTYWYHQLSYRITLCHILCHTSNISIVFNSKKYLIGIQNKSLTTTHACQHTRHTILIFALYLYLYLYFLFEFVFVITTICNTSSQCTFHFTVALRSFLSTCTYQTNERKLMAVLTKEICHRNSNHSPHILKLYVLAQVLV